MNENFEEKKEKKKLSKNKVGKNGDIVFNQSSSLCYSRNKMQTL